MTGIPPIQRDDTSTSSSPAPGTDKASLDKLYYQYRDQGLSAEDAAKIVSGHKALLSAPPSAMDTWMDYTVDHAMGHLNRPMDALVNMALHGGSYKVNRLMADQRFQDEASLHPTASGPSTAVAGAVLNPLNKLPGGAVMTGAELGAGTALEHATASVGTPDEQTPGQTAINTAIGAGGGAVLGKALEPVTGFAAGLVKGAMGKLSGLSDNVLNGVQNMFTRYGTDFNKVATEASQNPTGALINKFGEEANVVGKISPVAKEEIQNYLNSQTKSLTSDARRGIPEKMMAFGEPNIDLQGPSGQRLTELINKDPNLGKAYAQAQETLGKEKLPDLPEPGRDTSPFALNKQGTDVLEKTLQKLGYEDIPTAIQNNSILVERLKQSMIKSNPAYAASIINHPGLSFQVLDLMRENLMKGIGGAKTEAEKGILSKSLNDEFLPIINRNSPNYSLYQMKSGDAVNALNAHQGLVDQVTQGWGKVDPKTVSNAFLGKPGFSFSGGIGPWNVAINTAKQLFGKSVTPQDADQLAHLLVSPQGDAMKSIMTNYQARQAEKLLQAKLSAPLSAGASQVQP